MASPSEHARAAFAFLQPAELLLMCVNFRRRGGAECPGTFTVIPADRTGHTDPYFRLPLRPFSAAKRTRAAERPVQPRIAHLVVADDQTLSAAAMQLKRTFKGFKKLNPNSAGNRFNTCHALGIDSRHIKYRISRRQQGLGGRTRSGLRTALKEE